MEGSNYNNYQFSGERESMGLRNKIYDDGSKIIGRRSKDHNPKEYNSKEKVRKLTERRIVQRNHGRRLGDLIN